MKRIDALFRSLRAERRCGVIAYVTCGDPSPDVTVDVVDALLDAGVDAVELGVPFSDPIADGPVIQAASQRALERGTTIAHLFEIAGSLRARHPRVPLIAFSYLNPVLRLGASDEDAMRAFASRARDAGIDALLCTDLPLESAQPYRRTLHKHGLGLVPLLSPTSSAARVRRIDRAADGFIYYVSTTGVTGTRSELDPALRARVEELRDSVGKPLAVGFGISRREHYLELAPVVDAVVVGSAIVRAIAEGEPAGAASRAAAVVRALLGRE